VNTIRFDSRGVQTLPISTLCSAGASDIATSLVGLARVGVKVGVKDAAKLAGALVAAYQAIKAYDEAHEDEFGLLETGKVLTPIGNDGKRGQATMMVGLATCLVYRCGVSGHEAPTDNDLAKLVAAAKVTLGRDVEGNFSGPDKRKLMGRFADAFF